jgi:eukaryotic-like serine/threonine-protein kinase
MPLLPGETLHKRYRIVHLLAEGSYGAVYRTRDTTAQRDVAIKEYLDSSDELRKLFRQEAQRLNRLRHPQLPQVLDHFSLEGAQYLVSDFVDGVDLQSVLAQYGRLPTDLITGWLTAVSIPLIYLHELGQLHLNLKPANIRITPDGAVMLVNIGLPGLGTRPRSSGYGSPEQQAQLDVSPASDIYSLGATLYTLLTGIVPPNALSRESGLSELKAARELNPDVEPYLSLVAGRAMSLRADTRYESVAEFVRALQRPYGPQTAVAHQPRRTPAREMGTAVPPRLSARSRKQIEQRTIWGLLGLLIFIIIIGTLTVRINRPDKADAVSNIEATAAFRSAIIEAATALAPTPSPTPEPTTPPTPTPEPFITKTGSRMILVPEGIFRMGTEEGEADERPSHLVRISPFFIDETEVTNGAYAQCVDAGACNPPSQPRATTYERYYGNPAFANYPVIFVDWFQARNFCDWRGGRLPSEAEWEKAAGFDPDQAIILRYPWGEAFDGVKVNFCDANCSRPNNNPSFNDGYADTAPVGTYPDGRSPLGMYDMSGNVMEWVSDWYDRRFYVDSTDTNPLGPPEGEFRALRGGSWLSAEEDLFVYVRSSFDPTVTRANLGFRCAMDGS